MKAGIVAGVVAAGALIWAPAPFAATNGEPITGGWSGDVHDTIAGSDYTVNIGVDEKLKEGKKGGETFYPEFECGGDLILKKHKEGSPKYIFKEQLTVGVESCVDNGKVTLKREGRKLSYRWTIKGEDGSADGLLKRLHPE
jgi:hypothetical protein